MNIQLESILLIEKMQCIVWNDLGHHERVSDAAKGYVDARHSVVVLSQPATDLYEDLRS